VDKRTGTGLGTGPGTEKRRCIVDEACCIFIFRFFGFQFVSVNDTISLLSNPRSVSDMCPPVHVTRPCSHHVQIHDQYSHD
jgi:hypothetical protein